MGTRGPAAAADDCEKRKGLSAADLRTRFASGLFTNPPTHIHACAAFWANIILKRKKNHRIILFSIDGDDGGNSKNIFHFIHTIVFVRGVVGSPRPLLVSFFFVSIYIYYYSINHFCPELDTNTTTL